MKKDKQAMLLLCNQHLQGLYRAIEQGDVKQVYKIEHQLSQKELCVACAYALRAQGATKEVLDEFLREEGFIAMPSIARRLFGESTLWVMRVIFVLTTFLVIVLGARIFKTLITQSEHPVELGSFGILGSLILTIAIFIFVDEHVFE